MTETNVQVPNRLESENLKTESQREPQPHPTLRGFNSASTHNSSPNDRPADQNRQTDLLLSESKRVADIQHRSGDVKQNA